MITCYRRGIDEGISVEGHTLGAADHKDCTVLAFGDDTPDGKDVLLAALDTVAANHGFEYAEGAAFEHRRSGRLQVTRVILGDNGPRARAQRQDGAIVFRLGDGVAREDYGSLL